jgi:glycosyltransferase involved in cell wall biosynthesis
MGSPTEKDRGTPLLSVIIPCYAQAHALSRAVESVLHLGRGSEVEIVVVNDGSPDNAREVATSFGDKLIYVEQRNGGLSAARNAGLRVSSGEFVMFLDSDDQANPELEDFFSRPRTADVYPGAYFIFREWSGEGTRHLTQLPKGAPDIYNHNFGPPPSCIVRRTVALEVGAFDTSFKSCEDWEFWIRVWKSSPAVEHVDIAFASYWLYRSSMVSAYDRMWQSARLVWKKHSDLESSSGAWPAGAREDFFYRWTLAERVGYLECRSLREKLDYWIKLTLKSPETSRRFAFSRMAQMARRWLKPFC